MTSTPPRYAFHLFLLWLLGTDLRMTMLSVPPVLPLIHHDLGLDETRVAALSGLPMLIFGLTSIPASLLIARLGARRAAILGLLIAATGAAARGLGATVPMLFAMTAVMGGGIALLQPALPALVSRWFIGRAGFATAVYANGLLIGECVAAALTLPLVLPLAGGSWGMSMALWAIPLAASALLLALATADLPRPAIRKPVLWLPDWRDPRSWQLGAILASSGGVYFGANTFIPEYLHSTGRPELVGPCLAALNLGQLPASFLLLAIARRIAGRRAPLIAVALVTPAALAVFLVPVTALTVLGATVLGFCAAFILILSLALPPLLAPPDDVHRLSAGMFTSGYILLFLIPLIGGAAWDLTAIPAAAFLPVVLGAAGVLVLGSSIRFEATTPNR